RQSYRYDGTSIGVLTRQKKSWVHSDRAGRQVGGCASMKRRFLLISLLGAVHAGAQAPGQGIADGLFRLKEMDFHLHSGMERPVELDRWIDLAVADGRRVLLLLDHLELYRKSAADYEAWRSRGGFQARYPVAAAGHRAL